MLSSESYGFVDVHVHPPTKEFLIDAGEIHAEAAAKKFGHPIKLASFEEMLEEYSVCGVENWLGLLGTRRPQATGRPLAMNDEQLAIAAHKENVCIDLSGWSPKYFQPLLITYMTKMIPENLMFGTDHPMLSPKRWLDDFAALRVSSEITRMILSENARRLLKIK